LLRSAALARRHVLVRDPDLGGHALEEPAVHARVGLPGGLRAEHDETHELAVASADGHDESRARLRDPLAVALVHVVPGDEDVARAAIPLERAQERRAVGKPQLAI